MESVWRVGEGVGELWEGDKLQKNKQTEQRYHTGQTDRPTL